MCIYNLFSLLLVVIPEIRMNPSNVTNLTGQQLQLTCKAVGTDIVYHWMKNNINISIPADPNLNMLKIANITESDEGVYKCVASNKGGMVESNPATITVYGK